jgi:hypothetical protein
MFIRHIYIYIPVPLPVQMFITGINSLQKRESPAQRREHYTMAASSSNEQSIDNGLNLMMLSQDDGNTINPTSGIAGLTTVSSSSSTNKFLVLDTYETYRAHRHQLMVQQMTGQEMVSIIKEEEEEEFIINQSETNSTCCIMMVDMYRCPSYENFRINEKKYRRSVIYSLLIHIIEFIHYCLHRRSMYQWNKRTYIQLLIYLYIVEE